MIKASKNIVVLPDNLFNYISDSFFLLANMFAQSIGGTVVKYSKFDPNLNYNLVISVGSPSRVFDGEKFWKLKDSVIFIYWIDDMGCFSQKKKNDYYQTLKRADKILSPNIVKFSILWKEFSGKLFYFPFFCPDYFLVEKPNENSIKKCLLCGRLEIDKNNLVYPIRQKVFNSNLEEVEILFHPKEKKDFKIKNDFAYELRKYFCCVTDSHRIYYDIDPSLFEIQDIEKSKKEGQVVKKYFEIPASGCLLIADGNTTEEMEKLGFKDGENYVMVNEENVIDKIKHIISNFEKYKKIRESGLFLIKENHLLKNRKDLFLSIIKTL